MSPTSVSPLAETVPTWAISFELATGRARAARSWTTRATASSMPRFRSIGLAPAATDFMPSWTIAWASTVAVVVPSPAWSLVREATTRIICAPMLANLSVSSISLATVTPSLVIRGGPQPLSMRTLRPLGPSVTLTASASISTPRTIPSRASRAKRTSLAAMILSACSRTLRRYGSGSGQLSTVWARVLTIASGDSPFPSPAVCGKEGLDARGRVRGRAVASDDAIDR